MSINGGYEFDGREMSPVEESEVITTIEKFLFDGISNFVICGVFSTTKREQEEQVLYCVILLHFNIVQFTSVINLGCRNYRETIYQRFIHLFLSIRPDWFVGTRKCGDCEREFEKVVPDYHWWIEKCIS